MRVTLGISLLLSALPLAHGQGHPPKLAAVARFDLIASTSVEAIQHGQILSGDGTVDRMSWIPGTDQPRSYTVEFAAPHFLWSEAVFQFTPAADGVVELRLLGPWEPSPGDGSIYRQELFWDALTVSNTSLSNGSFEQVNGALPLHWTRPYGDASTASNAIPAKDGLRYARTWHDGPLTASLAVSGGLPITLRFHARAVLPANHVEMARLSDTNSPAHRAARTLMRGVNLGNHLEAPPGENWGATYSSDDFGWIRGEGFDHVRLPVAWHHHTGPAPDYTLSNSILAAADFLVTNALNQGLGAIVNIHHFDEFTSDPPSWTNKLLAIWRQLATHYSNASTGLVFELLNEPRDAATTTVLNPIYAEAIRQIRRIDATRTLMLGPGQFNSIDELTSLRLPEDDPNLIVTVHSYDPFLFTHQGATWSGANTRTIGIQFPGPPSIPLQPAAGVAAWVSNWVNDYSTLPTPQNPSSPEAFRSRLWRAQQWAAYYGRPVHIGEFGCYDPFCDDTSRLNFYTAFREEADALGLGWALWDWKAGFHYWQEDGDGGGPDPPGMRRAMFPPPRLTMEIPGTLHAAGAPGKTYVVEKALMVAQPTAWIPISTQVLVKPILEFSDGAAGEADQGFYRVEWLKHP